MWGVFKIFWARKGISPQFKIVVVIWVERQPENNFCDLTRSSQDFVYSVLWKIYSTELDMDDYIYRRLIFSLQNYLLPCSASKWQCAQLTAIYFPSLISSDLLFTDCYIYYEPFYKYFGNKSFNQSLTNKNMYF